MSVLVPCDNDCNCDCCLSGSESDDSDWSIGWLEPLASDFRSNGDDGFAVLVPCYKPSCCKVVEEASNKALLGVIKNLSNEFSSGKFYVHTTLFLVRIKHGIKNLLYLHILFNQLNCISLVCTRI